MTPIRSRWLWCVLLVFAALPLWAEETVSAPPNRSNAIPEGTTFLIRLDNKLDTAKAKPGQTFKAKLGEDLVAADGSSIPRGRKIKGHVSAVQQGMHARMLLSFDEIETNHGWIPLIATVTGLPGEHAAKQPDEEGNIERKGMSKGRMIEAAAVGAGIGAGAGAAAGGGHGAAIGAGAGAGAGALAGFLTDHDLKLNKGTTLEVRLDHPLQVPTR
jgi:hypothetical protein